MLIPIQSASEHMCPHSAGREKPFGCRGRGCAAWVTLWMPGQHIHLGPGYSPPIAKAEIGACGLVTRFAGEDERDVALQEVHSRYAEFIAAGLIEPPRKTVLTEKPLPPPIPRNGIGEEI